MKMMIKNLVLGAAVVAGSWMMTGCVSTVDGRSKAGVPFAKDKVESRYERSVAQIIDATRIVLARNGTITGDDNITKTVTARIDTRTVFVKVTEIEPKISGVLVQARTKGGGADIYLASEMDKQIALQLAVGP